VREAEAITQSEALELGVIDVVADDVDALFEKLEGFEVEIAGEIRTLALRGAERRTMEMDTLTRLFNTLADPNVAFLLGMAGLLGLYLEFNQPGMIFPGLAGIVCLVLAGIAFQILPFSWVGLLMVLLGLGLIAAELFVPAYGLLIAIGLVFMLLGGTMVFDVPEVSDLSISFWPVLVPVVSAFGVFAAVVVVLVGRTMLMRQTAGVDEMIGAIGRAVTDLRPDGKIFIRGEYWGATSMGNVSNGESVEVIAVEGMRLRVRPIPAA
jgi:membrane-bound serine protease (ClpP class)